MIRPSQRLGINSKDDWWKFRRLSETTTDLNNNISLIDNNNNNNNYAANVNEDPVTGFSSDTAPSFGDSRPPSSSASSLRPSVRRPPRPGRTPSSTSVGSSASGRPDVPTFGDHVGKTGKKCNFCFNNKEPIEVCAERCN